MGKHTHLQAVGTVVVKTGEVKNEKGEVSKIVQASIDPGGEFDVDEVIANELIASGAAKLAEPEPALGGKKPKPEA